MFHKMLVFMEMVLPL